MSTRLIIIATLVVAIVALGVNLAAQPDTPTVTTFEECVAAGYPVAESHPRTCRDSNNVLYTEATASTESATTMIEPTLTLPDAQAVAVAAPACTEAGQVGAFESYNPNSGTWWFTLNATRSDCTPACVVDDRTKSAEVNWRCTGLRQQ